LVLGLLKFPSGNKAKNNAGE